MATGKLILCPSDPAWVPEDPAQVCARLRAIGLLGAQFDYRGRTHWHAGPAFLQHVTFLGCSPVVALGVGSDAPGAGSCSITCRFAGEGPEFVSGSNTTAPRCPVCRRSEPAWPDLVAAWRDDPEAFRWTCPGCGTALAVVDLDWRHDAGVGRFFVEIRGIYPSEAVPGEHLLAALSDLSGMRWAYFYTLEPDSD
jgi:hypothetical protein